MLPPYALEELKLCTCRAVVEVRHTLEEHNYTLPPGHAPLMTTNLYVHNTIFPVMSEEVNYWLWCMSDILHHFTAWGHAL